MLRFLKICTVLFTLYASSSSVAVHQLSKRWGTITENQQINCEDRIYSGRDAGNAAAMAAANVNYANGYAYPFEARWKGRVVKLYPLVKGRAFSGTSYPGTDFVVLHDNMEAVSAVIFPGHGVMNDCTIRTSVQQDSGYLQYNPNQDSATREAHGKNARWGYEFFDYRGH